MDLVTNAIDGVAPNGIIVDKETGVRAVLCDQVPDPIGHGGFGPGDAGELYAEGNLVGGDGVLVCVVVADVRVRVATDGAGRSEGQRATSSAEIPTRSPSV